MSKKIWLNGDVEPDQLTLTFAIQLIIFSDDKAVSCKHEEG